MQRDDIEIRELCSNDDISKITKLLHSAYKPLVEQGLKFWASWQDDDDTRIRFGMGKGYVALSQGRIVGTITFGKPSPNSGCDWLDRSDVAAFFQFGVSPEYQGVGLGSRMLALVEKAAQEQGYKHLVCDTAEGADSLIQYYKRKGFEAVGHVQWGCTDYRSVVLSKRLDG